MCATNLKKMLCLRTAFIPRRNTSLSAGSHGTGRPIVTTDTTGCRETVIEGKNGFMVPVKDISALESTMERFILQPELLQSMGTASLEYAQGKFDVNKVNATIMKAIGTLRMTV